ncbi:hypothetical protein [Lactobacillus hominis]|uniref:Uncharacterized protein n=1 Tax=Lactobacillus hominis DSM 23910 = CRBIP 24.179 TaxID=1423758 RepID=I7KGW5_9LACO|nr:hypothetical protein [Lactobacillus hominis]KRM85837.1 hypothetical protein FC41_GL000022 [Lactobacillus hominis DSM 23910 = CRBIP 24.179]MCT3348928.1 hypothetical protein [Lactobacillus hominis]CCI81620.1 Putative uncharacterized protein [Lactobacillus hominis DSM 23910 = CRBIP 24.179]
MSEYLLSEKTIIETIKNNLDGRTGIYNYTFQDVLDDVFNIDEYIIGYEEAEQALQEYGVFDALKEVQQFDLENYGKWVTDYADSEKVANTLAYILANRVFDTCLINAPGFLNFDSELTPQNVKYFKEALNEM